jgi:hypothetical protein
MVREWRRGRWPQVRHRRQGGYVQYLEHNVADESKGELAEEGHGSRGKVTRCCRLAQSVATRHVSM